MRPLVITLIVSFAAMTALPSNTAKAACLPDNLACTVHGGSGMVLERGRFVPRASSGNFYVDRATRAVTAPQESDRYRRATPEAEWDGLSNWQELDQPGLESREYRPGMSGISSTGSDPYGETASELDNDPEVNPRLRANQTIRRAPQVPARAQTPARGPTGIADAPQSAATSFFNRSSQPARR